LLATLSSEEEFALWLSAKVALPILRRLVKNADSPAEEGSGRPPGCWLNDAADAEGIGY
jgi:hypothetical protein